MSTIGLAREPIRGADKIIGPQATRALEALNALPQRTRSAFLLIRFEGQSYKAAAARLCVPVRTVEMDVALALRTLTQNLLA